VAKTLSRSPLLRGSTLSGESVAVPLRPRTTQRATPNTPAAIVEQARDDAESVLASAHGEALAMRDAARAEGLAEGRAEANEEVAGAMATLHAMARGLADQRALLEESAVQEATVLAVEIAARLVRAEVAVRPERVADVLRGAIRRAADRSRLVARVSPGDLAACRTAAPHILEEMGGIAAFEVIDDPRVMPGSCVLETTAGDVDATFESQLGRVLEALAAPPDETLVEPGPL
jgi:flagellar assembly protein FliH